MRGDPRAASARLPAVVPARRWSAWVEQGKQRRRERRHERAEAIVRLQAQEPGARRTPRPERMA
jgi:hypothetical protein